MQPHRCKVHKGGPHRLGRRQGQGPSGCALEADGRAEVELLAEGRPRPAGPRKRASRDWFLSDPQMLSSTKMSL